MEEAKGEDKGGGIGGRALVVRESDWRDALVVVMNMLRCIRCRDTVPLSVVVGRTPAPIGPGDLALGCLSF